MRRVGLIFVTALAILGAIALIDLVVGAVRAHYAVSCVDNDATDYGFELRRDTAMLLKDGVFYARHR